MELRVAMRLARHSFQVLAEDPIPKTVLANLRSAVIAEMAPHAAPDIFTCGLLALTIAIALFFKVGALPLMAGGAAIGLVDMRKTWGVVRSLMG